MPKTTKPKESKEATREARAAKTFLAGYFASAYEATPEGALKQRAQLQRDLLERKRKKNQLSVEVTPPKKRKAKTPRKISLVGSTDVLVSNPEIRLYNMQDELNDEATASFSTSTNIDTKPPANKKSTKEDPFLEDSDDDDDLDRKPPAKKKRLRKKK